MVDLKSAGFFTERAKNNDNKDLFDLEKLEKLMGGK
jgi:hypothetical protein